jgi:hypothetical protein
MCIILVGGCQGAQGGVEVCFLGQGMQLGWRTGLQWKGQGQWVAVWWVGGWVGVGGEGGERGARSVSRVVMRPKLWCVFWGRGRSWGDDRGGGEGWASPGSQQGMCQDRALSRELAG